MERDEFSQHTQSKFRAIALGLLMVALVAAAGFLYVRDNNGPKEDKSQTFQEKLEATGERVLAQNTVHKFMTARLQKNETEALGYLTERAIAMLEGQKGSGIVLTDEFTKYDIEDMQELEGGNFRFVVKVFQGGIFTVELMTVTKTLDTYFIDSIELAG